MLVKGATGIILDMDSANKRRRYVVTPPLTGWTHTQNDPQGCVGMISTEQILIGTNYNVPSLGHALIFVPPHMVQYANAV